MERRSLHSLQLLLSLVFIHLIISSTAINSSSKYSSTSSSCTLLLLSFLIIIFLILGIRRVMRGVKGIPFHREAAQVVELILLLSHMILQMILNFKSNKHFEYLFFLVGWGVYFVSHKCYVFKE